MTISAATDQMVSALQHGSLALWFAASSSVNGDPQDALMQMVEENGAFDASLHQLKQLVDPERVPTVDELRGKGSFTAVSATQSQFITAVNGAALAGPPYLVTDPTDVRPMFGVTPKYAFNAPVVPAVDESVTVVPSTTDATVVPNEIPGPCTG